MRNPFNPPSQFRVLWRNLLRFALKIKIITFHSTLCGGAGCANGFYPGLYENELNSSEFSQQFLKMKLSKFTTELIWRKGCNDTEYHTNISRCSLLVFKFFQSKIRVYCYHWIPPVLFRTNYYYIEILHGVTALSLNTVMHSFFFAPLPSWEILNRTFPKCRRNMQSNWSELSLVVFYHYCPEVGLWIIYALWRTFTKYVKLMWLKAFMPYK